MTASDSREADASLELRKAEAVVSGIIEERREPLAVALAAAKPISDAPRQPLEVERLLNESARRTDRHFDEIDPCLAMPDPPHKRGDRETSNVLKILDELERGKR
jgi:hypothetical protein